MEEQYQEDKTCRICATVDFENFNIFSARDRNLHDKILSVYPVIIYQEDPLPKNICPRCAGHITILYETMQKILRTQKKWIDNVRTNQPENNFVKVLDIIERNHRETVKEVMELTNGDFIMPPSLEPPRLLKFNIDKPNQKSYTYFNSDCVIENPITMSKISPTKMPAPCPLSKRHLGSEVPVLPVLNTNEITIQPCKKPDVSIPTIQKLQTLLESNGCSLYTVDSNKKKSPPLTKSTTLQSLLMAPSTSLIAKPSVMQCIPIENIYKCKYCPFKASELNQIARHELNHVCLSIYKAFERKYLPKTNRRGRIITIHDRKCIRCLNCWRIFMDNKTILTHWSTGNCEFYCQVCGKEFFDSPKMLREHVPAAHGISYRSSKRRECGNQPSNCVPIKNNDNTIAMPISSDIPDKNNVINKIKSESSSGFKPDVPNAPYKKIRCSLCDKPFPNFKARNSHMRTHKKENLLNENKTKNPDVATLTKIKEEPNDNVDDIQPNNIKKTSKSSATATVIRTPTPTPTPSSSEPTLKVKSLKELQDPCVSSQLTEDEQHSSKTEKKVDHMTYGKLLNCFPCGNKFTSKLEFLRHKKKCKLNNAFACQFCTDTFITSADLQLHILLKHKS